MAAGFLAATFFVSSLVSCETFQFCFFTSLHNALQSLKGAVSNNFMARRKFSNNLPSYDELIVPTVKALSKLGGSGTIEEINTTVYEIAKLSDEVLQIPHGDEGSTNEVDYRLAWSRTYLKKYGLLENSSRGVWALSKADINVDNLDYIEIVRTVREQTKQTSKLTAEGIEKEVIKQPPAKQVDLLKRSGHSPQSTHKGGSNRSKFVACFSSFRSSPS